VNDPSRGRPGGEPEPFSARWWQWLGRWVSDDFFREVHTSRREPTSRNAEPEPPEPQRDHSRLLLVVLCALGLAPAIAGLAFNVEGFLAHILAGLAGLILGAVLAVWLIDRLLRERRRAQWQVVRAAIRRTICERVVDLGTSYAIAVNTDHDFIGLVGPEDAAIPHHKIRAALSQLCIDLRGAQAALAIQLAPDLASSRSLYSEVSPAITLLGQEMSTRIIVLGDEPVLVETLLVLEREEHQWHAWIETVEQWGAPDKFAWQKATGTLEAAIAVYGYFVTNG
jgi:hypothetical protein